MTIATRSPLFTPSSIRVRANLATAPLNAAKLTRSSSWTRKMRSENAADASTTALRLGGAFFQVRVGTPRITSSSISKGAPGAVRMACASAIDIAGQDFGLSVVMVACEQAHARAACKAAPSDHRLQSRQRACQPRLGRLRLREAVASFLD